MDVLNGNPSMGDDPFRYDVGDQPGRGRYRCSKCADWIINVENDGESLPECFNCGPGAPIQYVKVGDEPVHLPNVQ